MPIKVFLCYAHEDEALLKQLKKHLKSLERDGLIELWDDRNISAGENWEREIHQRLNTAQIILLLVSPDFINSTYCYDTELQRALERDQKGEVRIIPVIGRAVDWQSALGHLQALPTDALPITDPSWHDHDRALYNVAESLRKIVTDLTSPSLLEEPQPPQPILSPPIHTDHQRWSRRAALGVVGAAMVAGGITWFTSTKRDTISSPAIPPRSGTTLLTYRGHLDIVHAIAWSPDSNRLASAGGYADRTVQIWDASKGMPPLLTKTGHSANVFSVAWSPDSNYLVSGSATPDKTIRVWDANKEGGALRIYTGHADSIWSVTWSPDSKYFASASNDTTVRIWEASKVSNPLIYRGHSDTVWSVAWSPDGKYLASASSDATVQIWDASKISADPLFIYTGHSGIVRSVAWSPDNKHLASVGDDATVQIWEASKNSNPPLIYKSHPEKIHHVVAWSLPDGKYLASSGKETVQIWDASKSNTLLGIYTGHFAGVWSIAWSPDGRRLASAGADKTVRVWKW